MLVVEVVVVGREIVFAVVSRGVDFGGVVGSWIVGRGMESGIVDVEVGMVVGNMEVERIGVVVVEIVVVVDMKVGYEGFGMVVVGSRVVVVVGDEDFVGCNMEFGFVDYIYWGFVVYKEEFVGKERIFLVDFFR